MGVSKQVWIKTSVTCNYVVLAKYMVNIIKHKFYKHLAN